MRPPLPFALALVLAVGLLSGCGASDQLGPAETSTSGKTAEVTASLSDAPELMDEGLYANDEVYAFDALAQSGALGALAPEAAGDPGLVTLSPIRPLRWWREIDKVRRHFEFEFLDPDENGVPTTAIASVKALLRGSFNILAVDPTSDENADPFKVRKRLAELAKHRFVLKLAPRRDEPTIRAHIHRRWKLVGISGVRVESIHPDISADVNAIDLSVIPRDKPTAIRAIRFQTRDSDVTVTDPLELQRLRAVMQFEPEEEIEITVTTLAPDDVVVLMHPHRKLAFHNNGDNTYSARWKAPGHRGFRFAGFHALSQGTLFDDEEPYSASAWILPYVVQGMGPALALFD